MKPPGSFNHFRFSAFVSDFGFRETIAKLATREHKRTQRAQNKGFFCVLCVLLWQVGIFAIGCRISDLSPKEAVVVLMHQTDTASFHGLAPGRRLRYKDWLL
jgi:hypothetical protein